MASRKYCPNIKIPKNYHLIPDDWKCDACGKTKIKGTRFGGQFVRGKFYPNRRCNPCIVAGKFFNLKTIKQQIDEYFEQKGTI